MSLSVLNISLTLKQLQDAVKASTDGEVVLITADNKAVKIDTAKLTNYTLIPVNSLKKLIK